MGDKLTTIHQFLYRSLPILPVVSTYLGINWQFVFFLGYN